MNDMRILELARAAGLSHTWTSATGEAMRVAPPTLERILTALGFPCGSVDEWQASLDRLAQAERSVPPMVTATVGMPIHVPGLAALAGKPCRVILEDGTVHDAHLPQAEGQDMILPPIGRTGYHLLQVADLELTIAVAPAQCFGVGDALQLASSEQPRLWGLSVQLYSLRRAGDGGYGDYTALAQFMQAAAKEGASAVAISPVHAMFSSDVNRFSPYGPSSRLFFNALHVDPEAVLGPEALREVLAESGDAVQALERLEQADLVEWQKAATLRLRVLRALYQRFLQRGERSEFDAFIAQHGEALQSHARFEALHAWRIARGEDGYWRHWPEELRDPGSAAVRAFARDHQEEVEFHAFLQWQAARALAQAQRTARDAGMAIGLITDLAVGADNGGSQAWSRQNEIITGLSVGAPPDRINPRGQAWGLGAFSPYAMKARGFHAYIEMLRAAFAYAGGVRIDHVLGLTRLWLVPDGAAPDEGAYLDYPCEDLLRLIALESWRHRAIVIGEDLGTVPAGFDRVLGDVGLLGIRVLLFQRDGRRFLLPKEWSAKAIATTTTHDLPTIAGWWKERDLDWRSQLGLLEIGQSESEARAERAEDRSALWQALQQAGFVEAHALAPDTGHPPVGPALAFTAATPAPLAMLPIEDLLGLDEQPNLPGTIDVHPNWRRRLPARLDALLEAPDVRTRLKLVRQARGGNA